MSSIRTTFVFAYANDRRADGRSLRNLPVEQRGIKKALERPLEDGQCDVVELSHARPTDVFDTLLGPLGDSIALFHFAGHAGDAALIFESDAGAPTPAHGDGLAEVLGRQQALQLVFLNGCATHGHATRLLGAGVPAVIVTDQAIDDAVAAELATRFYQGVAAGRSIQRAFDDAVATLTSRFGRVRRAAYHRSFVPVDDQSPPWPWRLYAGQSGDVTLISAPRRSDPGDVIISVSEPDRTHATQLASLLDAQGRTVLIADPRDNETILRTVMEAARLVVMVLSDASAEARHQGQVARVAEDLLRAGKVERVVPLYVTGFPAAPVAWDLGLRKHDHLDGRALGLEEAAFKLGDLLDTPRGPAPPAEDLSRHRPSELDTFGGYFHHAALKIDRTKQWWPIVRTCSADENAVFLLHGPRRQNLDLFIYRIWRFLSEVRQRPHRIHAIPFRRFFAKPRSVPEWENHVRYALGGENQRGTAAKLLRDAARQSSVLLVLGEVPIEAGRLDEVECRALIDFVRGRLPALIAQAAEGGHPVRVLIATHYERAGDSWVDTLDQALVDGASGGDPRYLKLPALQPLTWNDIVEFLDELQPRPPRHIYDQLRNAWERLDQGDLTFAQIVDLLKQELF